MPDVRDLLRGAADSPSGPLDVDRVRARARQRQVRRRAGLMGAAAAVLAVVVLAGGLFASRDPKKNEVVVGPDPSVPTTSLPTVVPGLDVVEVPVEGASAVALGNGTVWVGLTTTDAGPAGKLLRLDPDTLAPDASAVVSVPPQGVAIGRGAVWATGGGDGAAPEGMIARNDLGTQGMSAPNLVPSGASWTPRAIGMTPDDGPADPVWVAEQQQGQLLRINPESNSVTPVPLGQVPTSIAVDGDDVWVGTTGPLLHVDATTNAVRPALVHASSVVVGRDAMFVSTGGEAPATYVVEADAVFDALSAATPLRLQGVGGRLAADRRGDGVWVAEKDGVSYVHPDSTSPGGLGIVADRELSGVVARDLVDDGRYLWIVTEDGRLLRWRPPAR